MSEQAKKSVSIFISYNHQDDRYEDELQKHLRPLRRQGLISDVFDGSVNPGTNYQDEVSKRIET
ncbi:MAG TPA: hypothetical protein VGS41_13995, partial [Chthonomonadales bacterium]|nr:hypothetical protein [Chthonomonadales bacterium]